MKTVLHARALGYECTIVESATYAKDEEPDPEWRAVKGVELWRCGKSAGARLTRRYFEEAGVRVR